jgi:4-hydroxymandelate oxidase
MTHPAAPLNLFDYETLAEAKLPPPVWDYICAGAEDGVTLAANRRAFQRWTLRPRMLVDVSQIELATTVLGERVAAPILVAPTALHGAVCTHGECATAAAAGRAGVIMVAASGSSRTIEDIAAAARGPLWLQLYVYADRPRTLALVRRAEAAGCRALALTVDSPRWGRKERSLRSEAQFDWPDAANDAALPAPVAPPRDGAPVTWDDLGWLSGETRLPIVLKGVLTAEDARLAAAAGVAGVIVSNHGGRQLDGAIASLDALPEVVEAAGARCEIYLDGGVRRGSDVMKALALGARAVLVGRPVLWGLAVGGADGACDVLEMLREELARAMALSGRPTLASLDRTLLTAAP